MNPDFSSYKTLSQLNLNGNSQIPIIYISTRRWSVNSDMRHINFEENGNRDTVVVCLTRELATHSLFLRPMETPMF